MSPFQSNLPSGYDKSKWFSPDIQSVPEPARTLFAEYSKIPDERIVGHVNEIRKRAFDACPYPCIGVFRFLGLDLHRSPAYPEILDIVKSGGKFLDLGCALGQEIRKLVYDGAPSENIYGSDIVIDLANVGYDLFRDHDTLKSEFIVSDIFDDNSELVNRLTGQLDIVNTLAFFHLFDWDKQVAIAKRIVGLLRPHAGSLLVGQHIGCINPHNDPSKRVLGYCHNEETWKRLWEVVERETDTKWKVDVVTESWEATQSPDRLKNAQDRGMIKLRFEIRRQ